MKNEDHFTKMIINDKNQYLWYSDSYLENFKEYMFLKIFRFYYRSDIDNIILKSKPGRNYIIDFFDEMTFIHREADPQKFLNMFESELLIEKFNEIVSLGYWYDKINENISFK